MPYFDKFSIRCPICGHTWAIASDKYIGDEIYNLWMKETIIHHILIHKDMEK